MGGQAALVTGSSRGIGLGAAVELARAGFAVAVNGPAEDAELAGAVERVRAEGGAVVATAFDVADVGAHAAALERIEAEIGPLTTLVNNAGVGVMSRGDVLDVTPESWDRCMAVNARGAFFLTQAFARMAAGAGAGGGAVPFGCQRDVGERVRGGGSAGRILRVEGGGGDGVVGLRGAAGGGGDRGL